MLFALLLGAVCTREALLTDYMIASKVRLKYSILNEEGKYLLHSVKIISWNNIEFAYSSDQK